MKRNARIIEIIDKVNSYKYEILDNLQKLDVEYRKELELLELAYGEQNSDAELISIASARGLATIMNGILAGRKEWYGHQDELNEATAPSAAESTLVKYYLQHRTKIEEVHNDFLISRLRSRSTL